MSTNPLIDQAKCDRHPDKAGVCALCGSAVSTYNANAAVVEQRPEARDLDWWAACDNADCSNAYGDGCFQGLPDWVLSNKKAPEVSPEG